MEGGGGGDLDVRYNIDIKSQFIIILFKHQIP